MTLKGGRLFLLYKYTYLLNVRMSVIQLTIHSKLVVPLYFHPVVSFFFFFFFFLT